MNNPLEYLIYGTPDATSTQAAILAHSTGFNTADVPGLIQQLPLAPLPAPQEAATSALLLMAQPGQATSLLARVIAPDGDIARPLYQLLMLPHSVLDMLAGDMQPLITLISQLPLDAQTEPAPPLMLPDNITWTADKRIAMLRTIYDGLGEDFEALLALLGAALHPRGLLIQHFTGTLDERVRVIQSLMLMLPVSLRSVLTFTTHTLSIPEQLPAIVFSDAAASTTRLGFDWAARTWQEAVPESQYMAYLRELWRGDFIHFVEALRSLDLLAAALMPKPATEDHLGVVIARHQLDRAVMNDEANDPETLIIALMGAFPPTGELRARYYGRLLIVALEQRHPRAIEIVAQGMETDPELNASLTALFNQALDTLPDAVYIFARAQLVDKDSVDERWLTLLRAAAAHSIQIALAESDASTLANWLKLLAREPARYQLGDLLHNAVLDARTRVSDADSLSADLLMIAVKRDPEVLPVLIEDDKLVEHLPPDARAALFDQDSPAIEHLADQSRELFLLALLRAVEASQAVITPSIIKRLWELYRAPGNFVLSEPYYPINVMQQIMRYPAVLTAGALETLLTLMIAASEDDLLRDLSPAEATLDWLEALAVALDQSARPIDDLFTLLNALLADGKLTYDNLAQIYTRLVQNTAREDDLLTIAEALARLLTQHPDVTVTAGALWRMLELASAEKSDLMVRVAAKRLLTDFTDIPPEAGLIDSLQRLRKAIHWNPTARGILLSWWRNFARNLPIATLQKLEKTLEAKRKEGYEEFRSIVQTALAVRKVIGQKSLDDFARDINTAQRILQMLADSFDPETKQTREVDTATLRGLFGAKVDELSPDARHVLATNLRELAQVITSLAENRSKPTLLSRDDTVDRALINGDQQPESALDVMKYLSGFLDGTQNHKSNEGV